MTGRMELGGGGWVEYQPRRARLGPLRECRDEDAERRCGHDGGARSHIHECDRTYMHERGRYIRDAETYMQERKKHVWVITPSWAPSRIGSIMTPAGARELAGSLGQVTAASSGKVFEHARATAAVRAASMNDRIIQRLRDARALATLVGDAPSFAKIVAGLTNIARSDRSVLITGETGTGKELVARAIHYLSARAPFPFVALNCGLLADALLDDELFGHERGAFTDAREGRQGLIAQGDKGTLFLDEVDALTPRAQVALLRVLQDRTFRALGSAREQYSDVRFVAASNARLAELVEAGRFRVDLFYRLSVFAIELPPLRERTGDIVDLARHFLAKHDERVPPRRLSRAAEAALVAWPWPGNVRELENAIVRGINVSVGDEIQVDDLGLRPSTGSANLPGGGSFKIEKQRAIDAFERAYLTALMRAQHGNVSQAARVARKERRDFGRLLKKHGLDARRFAEDPPEHRGGGEAPAG